MANIFDAVKEAVSVPMAAERYGLTANRTGMVCQMLEPMDYMASVLAAGTLEQRIRAVDRLLAEGKMDQLEERLNRIKEQERMEEN